MLALRGPSGAGEGVSVTRQDYFLLQSSAGVNEEVKLCCFSLVFDLLLFLGYLVISLAILVILLVMKFCRQCGCLLLADFGRGGRMGEFGGGRDTHQSLCKYVCQTRPPSFFSMIKSVAIFFRVHVPPHMALYN